jgi:two-component system nitrogen regulation sensor histidine kinase GlnL
MPTATLPSLEHLATAVILLDEQSRIAFLNPAAEHLFGISSTNLIGHPLQYAFSHTEQLFSTIQSALSSRASHIEHEMVLGTHASANKFHLSCTATPLQVGAYALLLEFHTIDRPLKLAREEQMLDQTQANRLLLRNLAHEIKKDRKSVV